MAADDYYGKILADPSCRSCGRPGSEAHHLVRRGAPWFGEDVPENVVCLCKLCHTVFHGGQDWVRVGQQIGEDLEDDEIGYVVGRAGIGYLARYYLRGAP